MAETFPQPCLRRAGRECAPHSAAPLASPLGPPENVFSYLSAIIRHPGSDRGMHGTSTLSQGEGIRGSARTHTQAQTESANFAGAFSSPSFLPPPLFEPQGAALIGPGAARGSPALPEPAPCPQRAQPLRRNSGTSRAGSTDRCSAAAPSLPFFLLSFQRGVGLPSVAEILAELLGGWEERFIGDNFQGCRREKDAFSFLHENETSLKSISGAETRWL